MAIKCTFVKITCQNGFKKNVNTGVTLPMKGLRATPCIQPHQRHVRGAALCPVLESGGACRPQTHAARELALCPVLECGGARRPQTHAGRELALCWMWAASGSATHASMPVVLIPLVRKMHEVFGGYGTFSQHRKTYTIILGKHTYLYTQMRGSVLLHPDSTDLCLS